MPLQIGVAAEWLLFFKPNYRSGKIMCLEEMVLTAAIANARSLGEIETWLKSQKCVKSVRLEKYLLKSNPPQRDFIVELEMKDGTAVKKIVNIFDKGDQQFQFHRLRDG